MADHEQELLAIIKNHAVGVSGDLTRDTPVADLGIDSFAIVEIVYEVEGELGAEVAFNANQNPFGEMKTVGDLLDAVQSLMKQG